MTVARKPRSRLAVRMIRDSHFHSMSCLRSRASSRRNCTDGGAIVSSDAIRGIRFVDSSGVAWARMTRPSRRTKAIAGIVVSPADRSPRPTFRTSSQLTSKSRQKLRTTTPSGLALSDNRNARKHSAVTIATVAATRPNPHGAPSSSAAMMPTVAGNPVARNA